MYKEKNWCKQNVGKAQEWGGMYQRYKKIKNFNKIQRLMLKWHGTKSLSKGKMIHNDDL